MLSMEGAPSGALEDQYEMLDVNVWWMWKRAKGGVGEKGRALLGPKLEHEA